MKESTTYQWIVNEGRIEALQKTLLRQGRHRFGPPDESVKAVLQGLMDVEKLERMTERLLFVSTWQELLETP